MNPFARYPGRTAAALGALLLAAACTDRSPVNPDPVDGGGTGEPGAPVYLTAVSCQASVPDRQVRCTPVSPDESSTSQILVLGGQSRYISLEPGAVDYNPSTQTYGLQMSVRNLVGQALGTTDGTTTDPGGVKVFLQNGPYVTQGTGNVTVTPDGVGTFTGSSQPYFQYNQVLDQFETSAPRSWTFNVPPTVVLFGFTAYVATAVQFPDGWVDVSVESLTMHPHSSWRLIATSRDAAGNALTGQFFTWTSPDTTVATVDGTGLLGTLRAGTVSIGVTSGTRTGAVQLTVTGMQRVWQGDVSNDYFVRGNWENDIVPVSSDTIVINNPSTNYPSLTANAQVSGIQVAEGALLNLNAFDMTASRNVVSSTAGSTGITSTTGRLFLSGIAGTVSGRVPRLRVTGTYSLTGNLWVVAPLQVDAGRLTNSTFRVDANNN